MSARSGAPVVPLLTAAPTVSPGDVIDPPEDLDAGLQILRRTVGDLWEGLLRALPLVVLALLLVAVGLVVASYAERAVRRGLRRTRTDEMVRSLTLRLLRIVIVVAFALLALAVAGVNVGAALAALGIAGLAIALALQPLLENFVAGIMLLVRKPFVAGDQIITGDLEGTVREIDLRVTQMVDYDGEHLLVPNADVLSTPLVNLTRRGRRRTRVTFAVDYRDDHNAVPGIVAAAIRDVDGVLEDPPAEVLCTSLAESGVEFEALYWTLPDISSVIHVEDRVLRRVKDTLEDAGMTIPWPIRTVAFDAPPEADHP